MIHHSDPEAAADQLFQFLVVHPGAEFTAEPFTAGLGLDVDMVKLGLLRLQVQGAIVWVGGGRYRLPPMPVFDSRDTLCFPAPPSPCQGPDPWWRLDRGATPSDEDSDVIPRESFPMVIDDADLRRAHRRMVEWYLRRVAVVDLVLDPLSLRHGYVRCGLDPRLFGDEFDDTTAALAWFDSEHVNILTAQRAAASRGWHQLTWEFADALWLPLLLTCRSPELAQSQCLGADAAAHCGHILEPVFRAQQGLAESSCGRPADALATCDTAVTRATDLGAAWALSAALDARARVHLDADDPDNAEQDLIRALRIDEDREATPGIALRHWHLGKTALHPKALEPGLALHYLTAAAELFIEVDDEVSHARCVISKARALGLLGHSGTALTELAAIEDVLSDYGAPGYRGDLAVALAETHTQLRNPAQARRYYGEAAEHYAAAGHGATDALRLAQRSRDAIGRRRRPGRAS